MRNIKRNVYLIIGQLSFFTLFSWYYLHNSFLRPTCDNNLEWFLAFTLVVAMTINYWIIYPLFYKRHSFWFYFLTTVGEAFLVSVLEYYLTLDSVSSCIPQELSALEVSHIKRTFFGNLFVRDTCLLGFAGLMANHLGQKFRLLEKDTILLKRKNQVFVQQKDKQVIIDVGDICYLIQNQNYTEIHTNNGKQYKRRGPMNFFEILQDGCGYVKISKNCAVFLPYIQGLTDKDVTVRMDKFGNTVSLPFGTTIAPAAILSIDRYLQNNEDSDTTSDSNGNEGQVTQEFLTSPNQLGLPADSLPNVSKNSPRVKARNKKKHSIIIDYITNHSDCNIYDIVSETKIPKSTVTRILAELKKEGLIEYTGSKKTGGYWAVEKGVNINT